MTSAYDADRTALLRRIAGFAVVLTLGLIMLGAWVRLTDAGLGCPDWPGCYGKLSPVHASDHIARAVDAQGGEHGPVSMGKAWREMVHRYIATFLGLLIVVIAVLAWVRRADLRESPLLPTVLVGVVVLQGLFGKWTVTLLLKPAIVTGHLIGGMLTFSLLLWFWLRLRPRTRYVDAEPVAALRWPAVLALVVVAAQIALGGWVSTNYAALACTDLPTCQGAWWPQANFADGFHVIRELGKTGEGEFLPMQALTAIHLTHRIGAVIVLLVVGWVGLRAARTAGARPIGIALLTMLAVQWALGLSNIWFSLPLGVAVAHNGGGAVLLGLTVVLNFLAYRARYQV
ncbi:MAG TPA: COX15/CtaA family protein [Quisquiliibacterium sp.]|nr:COX15/CtaA family protein [Quisquiliibacterium sp.]HQD84843.1 COX15/CtaA family protein [Quisquiliibacterium sp.]HQN14142.1 COX15/CtaA family protein [Quisquiliibacterium sp.]HQP68198.1 COX15/CtaA family protein [Quisquiliibacterium sp.]